MGLFDRQDDDEAGLYALLRGSEGEAAAVKASRHLEKLHASLATDPSPSETGKLERKVVDLEHKLLSLGLFTRTLMRLLVEKGVVTQAELDRKIDELDMEDGIKDGR
jgi:hypothetical protein